MKKQISDEEFFTEFEKLHVIYEPIAYWSSAIAPLVLILAFIINATGLLIVSTILFLITALLIILAVVSSLLFKIKTFKYRNKKLELRLLEIPE